MCLLLWMSSRQQQGCAVLTPARNALVYFHAGSSIDEESCAGWPIRLDVLSTSSHSNELKSRQLGLSFAACAQHGIMGRSSTRLALCDWSLMFCIYRTDQLQLVNAQ